MLALFWIFVIALVAAGCAYFWHQRQQLGQPKRPKADLLPRTLFNLQVGDFVSYAGEDWAVEGRRDYKSGGYDWLEYLLQIDDRIAWLSIDEGDRLVTSLLEPTEALKIDADPPKELNFAGERYRCVESGQAWTQASIGTGDRLKSERCQYWDYEGPDGKVLSVENWQGSWEVTVGEKIPPRALGFLAGDGKSIYRSMD